MSHDPSHNAVTDEQRCRVTALTLMRMALGLLDRSGHALTAARLQHAIDTCGGGEDLSTDRAACNSSNE